MQAFNIFKANCEQRSFSFLRHFCKKPPTNKDPPVDASSKNSNNKNETKKRMLNLISSMKKNDKQYKSKVEIPSLRADFENKKMQQEKENERFHQIDPEMKNAVKEISKVLTKEDSSRVESELAESIRSQVASAQASRKLLLGMRVDKSTNEKETYSNYDENGLNQVNKGRLAPKRSDVPLFSAKLLGILPEPLPQNKEACIDEESLETWKYLNNTQIRASVTYHPRNEFEEFILWTEQGKFWQFPIDNEIGLDEEKSISFAQHIFLETHLEGWCPKRGPIRHFMELVCNGLSKNPYITVDRKKAHIEWYKNYFAEKSELLKEIEAM